jgi:hypothetical protein
MNERGFLADVAPRSKDALRSVLLADPVLHFRGRVKAPLLTSSISAIGTTFRFNSWCAHFSTLANLVRSTSCHYLQWFRLAAEAVVTYLPGSHRTRTFRARS